MYIKAYGQYYYNEENRVKIVAITIGKRIIYKYLHSLELI